MPAYIDHALSFARMNSVIVRNGTRPTAITVAPSSRRGPSSPAMRISILMSSQPHASQSRKQSTHVDWRDQSLVFHVQTGAL